MLACVWLAVVGDKAVLLYSDLLARDYVSITPGANHGSINLIYFVGRESLFLRSYIRIELILNEF